MDYLQINELYHHGIKGMKWGVRRFQNEDGSLTPKGLKRQNKINKEAAKYENKAFKAELRGNIKAADTYSEIASKLKKQDLTHKTYDEIKRRSNLKVAAATVAGLLGGALLTTSVARYLNRNKPASSTDHGYIAEQIALGTLFCGEIGFVTSRAANSSSNALKRYNKQFASSSDKKNSAKHSDIYTEELYHAGVKGMKWGVRHEQNKSTTAKTVAKNTGKIVGGAAGGAAAGWLGVLGTGIGLNLVLKAKNSAITKKVMSGNFKGNLNDALAKTQRNYDKIWDFFSKHGLKMVGGAAAIGASTTAGIIAAKHINKKKQESKDSAKHSDIYTDEFYHSGVKGMKWGIRRYQNEDGTLTDAGKVRYNPDGSKKRVEKMSDAELNKANQRLSAEQNYNRLTGKYYKNRPASTDIALKAGVSALGGALLSSGAYIIRDVAKNPGTKLGKSYFKSDKMKTATALGVLGATIASISSVVTSLGGQASIQNIGDQSKKKG